MKVGICFSWRGESFISFTLFHTEQKLVLLYKICSLHFMLHIICKHIFAVQNFLRNINLYRFSKRWRTTSISLVKNISNIKDLKLKFEFLVVLFLFFVFFYLKAPSRYVYFKILPIRILLIHSNFIHCWRCAN